MKPADLAALERAASPAVRDALRAHALRSCPPSERPPLDAALRSRDAHVAQGRAAQRGGASSEDAVEAVLRAMRLAGTVADFARHDATVKARGDEVLYRVAGACDFTGILCSREGFAIEVKRGARLWRTREHAVAAGKSRDPFLTKPQTEQLARYHRAGCLALVAMVVGGAVRAVEWHALRWDAVGAESVDAWAMATTLREVMQARAIRARGTSRSPRGGTLVRDGGERR